MASERPSRSPRQCTLIWLLIDEAAGRAEAKRRHLRVTGTLGVLRSGAEQGLVDVPDLLERLKTTSFYLDETLVNAVFDRWLNS